MRYLAIRGFDLEEYSVIMSKQQLNILLLCSFESTYVTQLRENIKNKCPYSKISLLTNERAKAGYLQKINLDEGEDIYSYRSSSVKFWFETDKIIRLLPKFDIIHSLWMEKPWGCHAKTLKSKTECLLCSVGGSDLYRDSKKKICKAYQLNLLNHSDWFSSENNETKEEFIRTYGRKYETIPHTINRFGVDIFDALINRKTTRIHNNRILDVPSDKIVICCGYNANPAHQHIDMIQSFQKFPQAMLEKLFFIFPMTYGVMDKGYIDKIKSSLNEFTNNYTILEKFMSTDETAEVVENTDIMIHVQTTDQMSSTMLAHMYYGNIVIAGAWLPYSSLKERGIYFVSVETVKRLEQVLLDIVENYEIYKKRCDNNPALVYSMSSWDVCVKEWIAVYEELLKEDR